MLAAAGSTQAANLSPGDVVVIAGWSALRWTPAGTETGTLLHWPGLPFSGGEQGLQQLPSWILLRGTLPPQTAEDQESSASETPSDESAMALLLQALAGLALRQMQPDPVRDAPLDADISQVLWLMQKSPEKPWTLEMLAREVDLSRSVLAERFKAQTGETPMQSLNEIRMRAARDLLRTRHHPLKEIARLAGYRSVSAFSAAYKRWSGHSPRRSGGNTR